MKNSPIKFWNLAFVIGLVVVSTTIATSLLIARAQQARPVSKAELDDIREAVFRHQFYHNASGQQQQANAYYLSIEDDKDPEDSFIERFKDNKPPVKKSSQAKGKFEVIDKDTGLQGLRFRIDSIKQISADEFEVEGGYYEAGLSASGNTYTVRRVNDKWKVTNDKMNWIA